MINLSQKLKIDAKVFAAVGLSLENLENFYVYSYKV